MNLNDLTLAQLDTLTLEQLDNLLLFEPAMPAELLAVRRLGAGRVDAIAQSNRPIDARAQASKPIKL